MVHIRPREARAEKALCGADLFRFYSISFDMSVDEPLPMKLREDVACCPDCWKAWLRRTTSAGKS